MEQGVSFIKLNPILNLLCGTNKYEAFMLAHLKQIQAAPYLRPELNLGCLTDIPTGRYHTGESGESLLSGGLALSEGVVAGPNHFKTTYEINRMLTAMDRYNESTGMFYCTELTGKQQRINEMSLRNSVSSLKDLDILNSDRFVYTDKATYSGTKWRDVLLDITKHRVKRPADEMVKTPFLDHNRKNIFMLKPFINLMDSISLFMADNVLAIQEKGGIGESDRNTESLRDALAKTQLLMEMPGFTAERGINLMMTAHTGDVHQLDPRSPPRKKMTYMNHKIKIKNAPEKFLYLPANVWWIMGAAPMMMDDKTVEFPRHSDDNLKGDTDLVLTTLCNLRGKGGPSGLPFDLIFSQSEGLQTGLSEYYYLKDKERYGLIGNLQNFQLTLAPDINLRRTVIRSKINESYKLRRALEITSELCQMHYMWHHLPKEFIADPQTIFDDIKKMGYDWDELLSTRGWWTFDNFGHPTKYLSTMDILNIRAGKYKPYWMQ